MTKNASTPDPETIRTALEEARNSEDGRIDPRMISVLETAISEVWRKVQAEPDTYVLTRAEFALFNFFLIRYRGPVAQRAVERYWNNFNRQPLEIRQNGVINRPEICSTEVCHGVSERGSRSNTLKLRFVRYSLTNTIAQMSFVVGEVSFRCVSPSIPRYTEVPLCPVARVRFGHGGMNKDSCVVTCRAYDEGF
ncbi:hypothetical protein PABG_06604 [Paracoccidioides brasiliensis Pb03]|nr:hypothetical protein PABG_06604 [Paracoccidioides brasiliensis Pb03]